MLRLALELRLSTLGLTVARLLVDVDLFTVRLRAAALLFEDANLFLDVRVALRLRLLVLVDGGSEGFVRLFVPFPSVCLRLR